MRGSNFDWRWIILIVIVAVIANGTRLPWPVLVLALAGGGGYLLYLGWRVWGGGTPGGKRVTYWRGQRIETGPSRGGGLPPLRAITPALPYLIIGGALVLAAFTVLFRWIGS